MQILFVDDQKRDIDSYVTELQVIGYRVTVKDNVDEALRFLKKPSEPIGLLILDIMMPSGSIFTDVETQDGLRTGVHFYHLVRENWPELPIIIFTSASEKIMETFRLDEKCWFFAKDDYLPYELAEEVGDILLEMK